MSNKIELLQKIKALADRGVDGEAKNAENILLDLMEKHGISFDDLDDSKRETVFFPYKHETERRLLHQIIFMVTGAAGTGCYGYYTNRKRKKLGAKVTHAERLEVELNFDFYNAAMQKELEIFFAAFAHKNNLFPQVSQYENDEPDDKYNDPERALKIGAMMEGMDKHHLRKMIEA